MYLHFEYIFGFIITFVALLFLPYDPKPLKTNEELESEIIDLKEQSKFNSREFLKKNPNFIENVKKRSLEFISQLDPDTKSKLEKLIDEQLKKGYDEEEMRKQEVKIFLIKAAILISFFYVLLVILTQQTNIYTILSILDQEFTKYITKHVIHYHINNNPEILQK